MRNPLKNTAEPFVDRSNWSLHEHCEYANAQLILRGINDWRRRQGLDPVRWVIRDGRTAIENA